MSFIVAITDYVFPSLEPERAVLEPLGVELRPQQCRTEEEIIALVEDADAVLNCYAKMTARVIEGMKRCRIIARYGIGVDNVDLAAASKARILVTNVPDYCIDEVSDHALALLLALARRIAAADAAVKAGALGRRRPRGNSPAARTDTGAAWFRQDRQSARGEGTAFGNESAGVRSLCRARADRASGSASRQPGQAPS